MEATNSQVKSSMSYAASDEDIIILELCGGFAVGYFLRNRVSPVCSCHLQGPRTVSRGRRTARPSSGLSKKILFFLFLSVLHPPSLRHPFFPSHLSSKHSSVVPGQGEG